MIVDWSSFMRGPRHDPILRLHFFSAQQNGILGLSKPVTLGAVRCANPQRTHLAWVEPHCATCEDGYSFHSHGRTTLMPTLTLRGLSLVPCASFGLKRRSCFEQDAEASAAVEPIVVARGC